MEQNMKLRNAIATEQFLSFDQDNLFRYSYFYNKSFHGDIQLNLQPFIIKVVGK